MPAPVYDNTPDLVNADAVDVLGAGKTVPFLFDPVAGAYRAQRTTDAPGTPAERRTVVSQQTLDLSAGTAVPLPAAPGGATSVQIQPQGADVRLNVAGGTPTATSGLLFGQDGIYDLYTLTSVKLIGTVAGAGVQAELVWRA